jgi:enoyl-CoA hydratase/carnithine racemase
LDLARVPGLGRKTYEQMTGLPLRADIFRHLGVVHHVLGASKYGVPNVKEVAARFKELHGFDGCILGHNDGYILASSWDSPKTEAFGAFAPQMYKKVAGYLRQLDLGGIGSITFFLEHQPFTLVHSGEIFVVAIHEPKRFSRKHVHLAQAVGAELGRRLSRVHSSSRDEQEDGS